MHCLRRYGTLLALLALLCVSPSACASSEGGPSPVAESSTATPSPRSVQPAESSTEAAQTESDEENSNQDLDQDEETSDENAELRYFHGYRCTVDCSGHEAGYKWAEDHDIDDVDNCVGNSQSFIEGCQAWVEENH